MRKRAWIAVLRGATVLALCAIAEFSLSGIAAAKTLAGVTMPDSMTVRGETLQLNGMGLRTFTFLKVHGYVAGLYVAQPSHDASNILAATGLKLLQIQYLHSAGLARVEDQFEDGRAKNCAKGCPKSEDAAFAQLMTTARAVKPGDTNTYIYGAEGLTVLFDDKPVTVISNPDFAQRMLGGMIGANPPTAILRDGLLGL